MYNTFTVSADQLIESRNRNAPEISARQGAEHGCLLWTLRPNLVPGTWGFCPSWGLPLSTLQAQTVVKLGTSPRDTRGFMSEFSASSQPQAQGLCPMALLQPLLLPHTSPPAADLEAHTTPTPELGGEDPTRPAADGRALLAPRAGTIARGLHPRPNSNSWH